MKKIRLVSTEEVVATIDYSGFQIWKPGEPLQTTDKILEKVKNVISLPEYHKCLIDCHKKHITLVVCVDKVIVDSEE